ncbi:hypothetical protein C7B67_13800 [filamentous cyanobacterium Phorm 6]|nr:hypothetical protein C7B67_13800 [filamentous cyanobacterium Phorm 6]
MATVTAEHKLQFPPEILDQLRPGDRYQFSLTETEIVLTKIPLSQTDLDEFLEHLEELEPNPNQPTLQEISEIVKEVRQELWSN